MSSRRVRTYSVSFRLGFVKKDAGITAFQVILNLTPKMAPRMGVEPISSCVTSKCPHPWTYEAKLAEGVGIDPNALSSTQSLANSLSS